jgi:hypothetical protein
VRRQESNKDAYERVKTKKEIKEKEREREPIRV